MQKIVINRCWGGFSLSPLAQQFIARKEGKEFYPYVRKTKNYTDSEHYLLYTGPLEELDGDGCYGLLENIGLSVTGDQLNKAAWSDNRPHNRDNLYLVEAVETLGDKANGNHASLRVVEIPDGVEWEIDEYDGMESVAEKHRTWS